MTTSADTLDLTVLTEKESVSPEEFVQLRKDAHCSIEAHTHVKEVLGDFEKASEGLSSDRKRKARNGIGLWVIGKIEESIEMLEEAKEKNESPYILGVAYMETGRFAKAIEQFEAVLEEDSRSALAKMGILEAKIKSDCLEEAEKMSNKMVKSFSDSADFLYLRGVLFEIQGYGSKATEEYEAAMAKEPGHPGATFRMASFLDRTGEDAEAMALYEQLRKLRPTHINTALNLGTLYEDKGDNEKALECYQAILDFFPTHPRARLYFKDARASVSMFYDEDAARREAKMKQVLMQPVAEISCSPRVRAAMVKLGIYTIGDLAGKVEEDFLSVPNFGRTSLREIKEILTSRGLNMITGEGSPLGEFGVITPSGDGAEDAGESGGKRLSEIEWSGRIQKLFENLNISTVGELLAMTEADLLKQKNLGMTSIKELRTKLGTIGVSMREE